MDFIEITDNSKIFEPIKDKIIKANDEIIKPDKENKSVDLDDNLSNNKVKTEIEPNTTGNNVNVSMCSCTVMLSCNIM